MLVKTMQPAIPKFQRVAAKSNVKRIENDNLHACYKNMGSSRIIWRTTWFLAVRHRVGLLSTAVIVLAGYIAYDKLLYMFF